MSIPPRPKNHKSGPSLTKTEVRKLLFKKAIEEKDLKYLLAPIPRSCKD